MSFARHLRNNATPEERALWRELSRLRPRFTRQLPIGPFVADFACRRARVIMELDGSQHVDCTADLRRTALLEADGWRVIRFWNTDVWTSLEGVVTQIVDAVADRLPEDETPAFIAARVRLQGGQDLPAALPGKRGGEQVRG